MALLLGLLLFSFLINAVLFIPFINLLYRLRFQRQNQATRDIFGKLTPIFDKLHAQKAGIPVGGGLLTLIITPILFILSLAIVHFFLVAGYFCLSVVIGNKNSFVYLPFLWHFGSL